MKLLDKVQTREDLLALDQAQLPQLCQEIRQFLVSHISQTGGHLASNLGVVELSVALERIFDTSRDRLLFDVGHQSYVHKMFTGRRDGFERLRQFGEMSGFPKPSESDSDPFVAGHASASVSTALGMARARTLMGKDYHVISVLGDGAMTGGLAYEAMNDAGASNEPLLVILNDNGMSILPNVGSVSRHLTLLRTRPGYFNLKRAYRAFTNAVPGGKALYKLTHRIKLRWKRMLLGSTLFEEMGFDYYGPVDGHNIGKLEYMLRFLKDAKRPTVLHVITRKGKGYLPAEENPDVFHGIGPFNPEDGSLPAEARNKVTFSQTFGKTLCDLARDDSRICAVTAAMVSGTGLKPFHAAFPQRCFDVGIAEGHAVSMAGGLAKQGMVPVVAIYSTFLQRAYDMLLQDVAMLNLHVIFAVDRAGLVGEDGETHHGVFDVNFLRSIPNMQILCPANQAELKEMLRWAVEKMSGPVAVRYPRGGDGSFRTVASGPVLKEGTDITLVSYGTTINSVLEAGQLLEKKGICPEILKLPSIKPIDISAISKSVRKTHCFLIAEEAVSTGCAGKEIAAQLREQGLSFRYRLCNLRDRFVTHGSIQELYRHVGLDGQSLAAAAEEVFSSREA